MIPLTRSKEALISAADADIVLRHRWRAHLSNRGIWYARTTVRGRTLFMHRLVLGLESSDQVADHIDRNTLNNTRANLRACSHQQNASRRADYRKGSAGYRGVSKHRRKWVAAIGVHGKKRLLGLFDTPEEASEAYWRAAAELFGEFAPENTAAFRFRDANPHLIHGPSLRASHLSTELNGVANG